MRVPTFRVRSLMAVVAGAAVALALSLRGPVLYARWGYARERAAVWGSAARQNAVFVRDATLMLANLPDTAENLAYRALLESRRREALDNVPRYEAMRRKYERAAWRLWEPADPGATP